MTLVAIRLHRWSIGAIAVLCLFLAVLSGWLALDIQHSIAQCRSLVGTQGCQELEASGTLRSQDVIKVLGLIGFLPFLGGCLLGAPLIAREVEMRTASLAWPLAISRLHWLRRMAAPVIGVGLTMMLVPAATSFLLVSSYAPEMDPWQTFEHFGLYGPALIIRLAAASAIGLLAGAWLGRTLPALIASAAGVVALYFVLNATYSLWLVPVQLAPADSPADTLGQLFVRQMVRMPNGRMLPIEDALAIDPDLGDVTESVDFGLPANRALDVALREDAALLVGSAIVLSVAAATLKRRRPY